MKRIGKTLFNLLMLGSLILGVVVLLHDFIFLTIIPFFSHEFYTMTYFGLCMDLFAYLIIKGSLMYFEELFK